jgi:DNA-3-methyladenine glycosylase
MKKLGRKFFEKETVAAAKSLLGKYLVRTCGKGGKIAGRIAEVEAYRGKDDPGSHAFRKRTPRNEVMFGAPGRAYVYFCYGNHYLFNIVTEKEGEAGAVLIRALEPAIGIETMMKRRRTKDLFSLTSGPAKLTQALGINKRQNRLDLTGKALYLAEGRKERFVIASGPRIGIKQGLDKMWRFWIKGSRFVSV